MARASSQYQTDSADWTGHIKQCDSEIYEAVMDAAAGEGIPFALGGAFALASYTGGWRNTKDLDLYVLPWDRERMIALTARLGLTDYYDQVSYDRQWIYRATTDGVIVDLIWAAANHRYEVDEWWMTGPEIQIRGRHVKVLPAEAMLCDKLFIMQRERCDWPDVMNLLYAVGPSLDWAEILKRLNDDRPLLAGALLLFRWLSPGRASKLPYWLWDRVNLPSPDLQPLPDVDCRRAALLDSRPWYPPEPARNNMVKEKPC